MKIEQIPFDPPLFEQDFTLSEKKVQGANIAKREGALFVVSASRYKLECTSSQKVFVLEGEGHFKWKRGETNYREGQAFLLEKIGEYELNGAGKYLIIF